MNTDYGYINKWLTDHNIRLQPSFIEQLKSWAVPFGKNII